MLLSVYSGDLVDDRKMAVNDKILVHGVGGKIIKASDLNQQLLIYGN
jgi:phosphate starvation-inducible PhoH-like protein